MHKRSGWLHEIVLRREPLPRELVIATSSGGITANGQTGSGNGQIYVAAVTAGRNTASSGGLGDLVVIVFLVVGCKRCDGSRAYENKTDGLRCSG